jgi:hypothetical protein
MNAISDLLQIFSAGSIGLLVGALLAEGALFVPYWQTLNTDVFYALHKVYGPKLYRFFAPLTVAPTVLSVAAALVSISVTDSGRWVTLAACILFLMAASTYSLYFRQANAQFAAATLNGDALSLELAKWERWQWVRVVLGAVAFFAALIGVGL